MNFPELSVKPASPLNYTSEDAVIRDQKDAGYTSTRPRFTRVRKNYTVNYTDMPQSDVDLLDDFYYNTCANGSVMFDWTHPSGAIITCRFKGPIQFSNVYYGYYNVSFELEQV